jgi:membrane protein insertase Oxa1/YidC/SpoIIIJ
MLLPAVAAEKKVVEKTATDTDDAMVEAQKQMLYLFPLMTVVVGFQFPSGLVLYWLVFSAVSSLQQYSVTGWGGLTPHLKKIGMLK